MRRVENERFLDERPVFGLRAGFSLGEKRFLRQRWGFHLVKSAFLPQQWGFSLREKGVFAPTMEFSLREKGVFAPETRFSLGEKSVLAPTMGFSLVERPASGQTRESAGSCPERAVPVAPIGPMPMRRAPSDATGLDRRRDRGGWAGRLMFILSGIFGWYRSGAPRLVANCPH